MMNNIKSALILAGDTDENIGDRAIVFSMCEELRRINPDIKLSLISGDPVNDRKYFGATAIRRGFRGVPSLIKAAVMSDLVICGGGGLFQDDDSLVKMPYWALRLLFIRLFNKNIVGYSLGVGPLNWAASCFFARIAFACMDIISVRDVEAKKVSERLTIKPVHLVPDPALLLPERPQNEADELMKENNVPFNGSPLIGVAVRKCFHNKATLIPHKYAVKYHLRKIPGKEKCEKMISLLAETLDRMVNDHGAFIIFMPTYNVAHEADYKICREIAEKMKSERTSLMLISDPCLYKSVAKRLSVMLGGRMHPAIFSAGVATSIVGLAYNQKFFGLFKMLGIHEKVISIEDFVCRELGNELFSLLSRSLVEGPLFVPRVREMSEAIRIFNKRIMTEHSGKTA